MDERLRHAGEFGFIAEIRKLFTAGDGVRVGIGDDAAVVEIGGTEVILTTDMLVEGVHFSPGADPETVGRKALACNASDIAAMGGRPLFALVSVGVPAEGLDPIRLLAGLERGARDLDVGLVGGDTTAAPAGVVSVAMVGVPGPGGVVKRSTARAGDLLCVTGTVGDAAAGLQLLRAGKGADFESLVEAHRLGRARVREGMAAASAGATAMIDVSDGVGADANHLAAESGIGLTVAVENLPVSDELRAAAHELGADAHRLAASGGEDYELLIAVHPHDVDVLRDAVAPTKLTVVGEFGAGAERVARWPDGSTTALAGLGWDHFR